jgi:hypothetical protein
LRLRRRRCFGFAEVPLQKKLEVEMKILGLPSERLSLWLKWVSAGAMGWILGLILGLFLFDLLGSMVYLTDDSLLTYVALPSIGISLGVSQLLILQRHVPRAWWWVLVCLAGYTAAAGIAHVPDIFLVDSTSLADDAAVFLLLGAVIGIPQWLFLRRHYTRALPWIFVNIIAWMGFLVAVAHPLSSLLEFIGFIGIIGAVLGAGSGLLFVFLMRERPSHILTNGESAA